MKSKDYEIISKRRFNMKEDIDFESAIEKLEEIVKTLETEKLSLDDSLSKFEEGIKLSKLCNKRLMEAKQKVEKLVAKDGIIQTEPFSG
jgi:exodeoxyribonuclease VII small subunit